jgi:glutathione peroxidase
MVIMKKVAGAFLFGSLMSLMACQNQSGSGAQSGLGKPETAPAKNLTASSNAPKSELMNTLHDYSAQTLQGEPFAMSELEGKRVLIVNTASECGFTPQYEGLQKLYEQHGGKDFTIIGFPSNDFGRQEPGSNEEIEAFCKKNFGVTFPMMAKTPVTGADKHPVYVWLTEKDQNGVADAKVSWNFNKFLIDENGNWIAHYPSQVKPMDKAIVSFARGEQQ